MAAQFRNLLDLTPNEFENFVYDVLSASGARNLTWRTPGADGGRDMEGDIYTLDFSGASNRERWYFECKRYSSSLDWPLVYEKLAYADVQKADFLLLVTTSQPSPACETQITDWNNQRRTPRIRTWRAYELHGLINKFPIISSKYGLRAPVKQTMADFLSLSVEISKISQAAYAASDFDVDARPALEASAALSELLSFRVHDLAEHGKFLIPSKEKMEFVYDWVETCGDIVDNDIIIRAISSTLRFVFLPEKIELSQQRDALIFKLISPKKKPSKTASDLLKVVGIWADREINETINEYHVSERLSP